MTGAMSAWRPVCSAEQRTLSPRLSVNKNMSAWLLAVTSHRGPGPCLCICPGPEPALRTLRARRWSCARSECPREVEKLLLLLHRATTAVCVFYKGWLQVHTHGGGTQLLIQQQKLQSVIVCHSRRPSYPGMCDIVLHLSCHLVQNYLTKAEQKCGVISCFQNILSGDPICSGAVLTGRFRTYKINC